MKTVYKRRPTPFLKNIPRVSIQKVCDKKLIREQLKRGGGRDNNRRCRISFSKSSFFFFSVAFHFSHDKWAEDCELFLITESAGALFSA